MDGAIGEVLFIPGILMGKAENYLPELERAYPQHNLRVVQWKCYDFSLYQLNAMTVDFWPIANLRAFVLSEELAENFRNRSVHHEGCF